MVRVDGSADPVSADSALTSLFMAGCLLSCSAATRHFIAPAAAPPPPVTPSADLGSPALSDTSGVGRMETSFQIVTRQVKKISIHMPSSSYSLAR